MFVVAPLLLLSSPAQAWKHSGQVWPSPDIQVCIRDIDLGPEWIPEARQAIATWDAVLAAEVGGSLTEVADCDAPGVIVVELGGEEPTLDPDLGWYGADVSTTGEVRSIDGCEYLVLDRYVGTLRDVVDYLPHEEIEAGRCVDQTNLQGIAAHMIGHGLGLGHSCDQGEPCVGSELIGALMYWTSAPCEVGVTPQEDDLAGLRALYGPDPECGIDGATEGTGMPLHPDLPPHQDEATGPEACGCASADGASSWTLSGLVSALVLIRRRR